MSLSNGRKGSRWKNDFNYNVHSLMMTSAGLIKRLLLLQAVPGA